MKQETVLLLPRNSDQLFIDGQWSPAASRGRIDLISTILDGEPDRPAQA